MVVIFLFSLYLIIKQVISPPLLHKIYYLQCYLQHHQFPHFYDNITHIIILCSITHFTHLPIYLFTPFSLFLSPLFTLLSSLHSSFLSPLTTPTQLCGVWGRCEHTVCVHGTRNTCGVMGDEGMMNEG